MLKFVEFLDQQQALVEDLEQKSAVAYWNASLSGSKEDESIAAALSAELQTKYSSAESLAFLQSIGPFDDHDLSRQHRLLIDAFKAHQSPAEFINDVTAREMEMETLFANFRASFRGALVTDNDIREILKESDDSDLRRDAWEASKQIGALASPKVLELVHLRNAEARRLGYDNFYAMHVALQELDENVLFSLLDSVSDSLLPAFTTYKSELDALLAEKFKLSMDELRPWHYSNPFFQDAPDSDEIEIDSYFTDKDLTVIARNFFEAIGFDIDHLLANSDLYERPGKNQHAYCTSIGRATHDIRVLCNLVPNAQWMATLLHELGHAVYDDLIDENLPFFLRQYTHTMTTEAIAEMMGRFANSGAWLRKYAGVTEADAAAVEAASRQTDRAHLLIFTQWVLVMAHFERELYRNPAQDLDELWWSLVERFQQLRRPDGSRAADWAAKIHLSTSPVYYHNYLLGEMTASQILWALKRDVAPSDDLVSSKAVGAWLSEKIFKPGARYDWNTLLELATGERLNPAHFVDGIVQK